MKKILIALLALVSLFSFSLDSLDAAGAKKIIKNEPATFRAKAQNGTEYEWTFPDKVMFGSEVQYTFKQEGRYPITLKVTPPLGNPSTASQEVIVENRGRPTAVIVGVVEGVKQFGASLETNLTEKIEIKSESRGSANIVNQWTVNGSKVEESQLVNALNKVGTYQLKLKSFEATDPSLSDEETLTVIIKNTPPEITKLEGTFSKELKQVLVEAKAEDLDGEVVQYKFDLLENGSSVSSQITTAPETTFSLASLEGKRNFSLSLTVRDNQGRSETFSNPSLIATDTESDNNAPEVKINVSPGNSGDKDTLFEFTADITDKDNDFLEYYWLLPNGTRSNATILTQRFNSVDDYTVSLVASDGVTETKKSITVSVVEGIKDGVGNQPPVVNLDPPTPTYPRDTKTALNFTAQVEDSDSDEFTYEWDMNDGTVKEGKNVVHTFVQEGDYNVKVKVSDGFNDVNATVPVSIVKFSPIGELDYDALKEEWAENKKEYTDYFDGQKTDWEVEQEEIQAALKVQTARSQTEGLIAQIQSANLYYRQVVDPIVDHPELLKQSDWDQIPSWEVSTPETEIESHIEGLELLRDTITEDYGQLRVVNRNNYLDEYAAEASVDVLKQERTTKIKAIGDARSHYESLGKGLLEAKTAQGESDFVATDIPFTYTSDFKEDLSSYTGETEDEIKAENGVLTAYLESVWSAIEVRELKFIGAQRRQVDAQLATGEQDTQKYLLISQAKTARSAYLGQKKNIEKLSPEPIPDEFPDFDESKLSDMESGAIESLTQQIWLATTSLKSLERTQMKSGLELTSLEREAQSLDQQIGDAVAAYNAFLNNTSDGVKTKLDLDLNAKQEYNLDGAVTAATGKNSIYDLAPKSLGEETTKDEAIAAIKADNQGRQSILKKVWADLEALRVSAFSGERTAALNKSLNASEETQLEILQSQIISANEIYRSNTNEDHPKIILGENKVIDFSQVGGKSEHSSLLNQVWDDIKVLQKSEVNELRSSAREGIKERAWNQKVASIKQAQLDDDAIAYAQAEAQAALDEVEFTESLVDDYFELNISLSDGTKITTASELDTTPEIITEGDLRALDNELDRLLSSIKSRQIELLNIRRKQNAKDSIVASEGSQKTLLISQVQSAASAYKSKTGKAFEGIPEDLELETEGDLKLILESIWEELESAQVIDIEAQIATNKSQSLVNEWRSLKSGILKVETDYNGQLQSYKRFSDEIRLNVNQELGLTKPFENKIFASGILEPPYSSGDKTEAELRNKEVVAGDVEALATYFDDLVFEYQLLKDAYYKGVRSKAKFEADSAASGSVTESLVSQIKNAATIYSQLKGEAYALPESWSKPKEGESQADFKASLEALNDKIWEDINELQASKTEEYKTELESDRFESQWSGLRLVYNELLSEDESLKSDQDKLGKTPNENFVSSFDLDKPEGYAFTKEEVEALEDEIGRLNESLNNRKKWLLGQARSSALDEAIESGDLMTADTLMAQIRVANTTYKKLKSANQEILPEGTDIEADHESYEAANSEAKISALQEILDDIWESINEIKVAQIDEYAANFSSLSDDKKIESLVAQIMEVKSIYESTTGEPLTIDKQESGESFQQALETNYTVKELEVVLDNAWKGIETIRRQTLEEQRQTINESAIGSVVGDNKEVVIAQLRSAQQVYKNLTGEDHETASNDYSDLAAWDIEALKTQVQTIWADLEKLNGQQIQVLRAESKQGSTDRLGAALRQQVVELEQSYNELSETDYSFTTPLESQNTEELKVTLESLLAALSVLEDTKLKQRRDQARVDTSQFAGDEVKTNLIAQITAANEFYKQVWTQEEAKKAAQESREAERALDHISLTADWYEKDASELESVLEGLWVDIKKVQQSNQTLRNSAIKQSQLASEASQRNIVLDKLGFGQISALHQEVKGAGLYYEGLTGEAYPALASLELKRDENGNLDYTEAEIKTLKLELIALRDEIWASVDKAQIGMIKLKLVEVSKQNGEASGGNRKSALIAQIQATNRMLGQVPGKDSENLTGLEAMTEEALMTKLKALLKELRSGQVKARTEYQSSVEQKVRASVAAQVDAMKQFKARSDEIRTESLNLSQSASSKALRSQIRQAHLHLGLVKGETLEPVSFTGDETPEALRVKLKELWTEVDQAQELAQAMAQKEMADRPASLSPSKELARLDFELQQIDFKQDQYSRISLEMQTGWQDLDRAGREVQVENVARYYAAESRKTYPLPELSTLSEAELQKVSSDIWRQVKVVQTLKQEAVNKDILITKIKAENARLKQVDSARTKVSAIRDNMLTSTAGLGQSSLILRIQQTENYAIKLKGSVSTDTKNLESKSLEVLQITLEDLWAEIDNFFQTQAVRSAEAIRQLELESAEQKQVQPQIFASNTTKTLSFSTQATEEDLKRQQLEVRSSQLQKMLTTLEGGLPEKYESLSTLPDESLQLKEREIWNQLRANRQAYLEAEKNRLQLEKESVGTLSNDYIQSVRLQYELGLAKGLESTQLAKAKTDFEKERLQQELLTEISDEARAEIVVKLLEVQQDFDTWEAIEALVGKEVLTGNDAVQLKSEYESLDGYWVRQIETQARAAEDAWLASFEISGEPLTAAQRSSLLKKREQELVQSVTLLNAAARSLEAETQATKDQLVGSKDELATIAALEKLELIPSKKQQLERAKIAVSQGLVSGKTTESLLFQTVASWDQFIAVKRSQRLKAVQSQPGYLITQRLKQVEGSINDLNSVEYTDPSQVIDQLRAEQKQLWSTIRSERIAILNNFIGSQEAEMSRENVSAGEKTQIGTRVAQAKAQVEVLQAHSEYKPTLRVNTALTGYIKTAKAQIEKLKTLVEIAGTETERKSQETKFDAWSIRKANAERVVILQQQIEIQEAAKLRQGSELSTQYLSDLRLAIKRLESDTSLEAKAKLASLKEEEGKLVAYNWITQKLNGSTELTSNGDSGRLLRRQILVINSELEALYHKQVFAFNEPQKSQVDSVIAKKEAEKMKLMGLIKEDYFVNRSLSALEKELDVIVQNGKLELQGQIETAQSELIYDQAAWARSRDVIASYNPGSIILDSSEMSVIKSNIDQQSTLVESQLKKALTDGTKSRLILRKNKVEKAKSRWLDLTKLGIRPEYTVTQSQEKLSEVQASLQKQLASVDPSQTALITAQITRVQELKRSLDVNELNNPMTLQDLKQVLLEEVVLLEDELATVQNLETRLALMSALQEVEKDAGLIELLESKIVQFVQSSLLSEFALEQQRLSRQLQGSNNATEQQDLAQALADLESTTKDIKSGIALGKYLAATADLNGDISTDILLFGSAWSEGDRPPSAYFWDLGDGRTSESEKLKIRYNSPGYYQIWLYTNSVDWDEAQLVTVAVSSDQ